MLDHAVNQGTAYQDSSAFEAAWFEAQKFANWSEHPEKARQELASIDDLKSLTLAVEVSDVRDSDNDLSGFPAARASGQRLLKEHRASTLELLNMVTGYDRDKAGELLSWVEGLVLKLDNIAEAVLTKHKEALEAAIGPLETILEQFTKESSDTMAQNLKARHAKVKEARSAALQDYHRYGLDASSDERLRQCEILEGMALKSSLGWVVHDILGRKTLLHETKGAPSRDTLKRIYDNMVEGKGVDAHGLPDDVVDRIREVSACASKPKRQKKTGSGAVAVAGGKEAAPAVQPTAAPQAAASSSSAPAASLPVGASGSSAGAPLTPAVIDVDEKTWSPQLDAEILDELEKKLGDETY